MEEQAQTLALIGSGPMALMTALEWVRQAPKPTKKPVKLLVVSREPEEKFGWGDVADTMHPEVIFNVALAKMGLDPRDPNGLLEQVKKAGLDEPTRRFISELNTSTDLADLHVPRRFLHALTAGLRMLLKNEIEIKGLGYEFLHAEVYNLRDDVKAEERKLKKSKVTLEIGAPGRSYDPDTKEGIREITVDVAAITFGSPKKQLPGEKSLKDSGHFCPNPHQPRKGHVLHPETDLDRFPDDYSVGVAGSKLTALDVGLVLYFRGYFNKPSRKLVFVSPSGEFPFPHEERNSNSDGGYKNNSLLRDPALPPRLLKRSTAADLTHSLLLCVTYAMGAVYRQGRFHKDVSEADRENPKAHAAALQNILLWTNSILEELSPDERRYVEAKFSVPREREFSWQVAVDVDFRPNMQAFWQGFSASQKELFYEQYEGIWNKLRHRVPVKVLNIVDRLREQGQIRVERGSISSLSEKKGGILIYCNHDNQNPLARVDTLIKATGWEFQKPIDVVPMLRMARRNNIVHTENTTGMGVVVDYLSRHNVLIIGQLRWILVKEISGFQQLAPHAKDFAAPELWKMLQDQEEADAPHQNDGRKGVGDIESKGPSPFCIVYF